MTTLQTFLARCAAYKDRRGIKRSYLSRLLFDDGKLLGLLEADSSGITIRSLARADRLLGEFERALVRDVMHDDAAA